MVGWVNVVLLCADIVTDVADGLFLKTTPFNLVISLETIQVTVTYAKHLELSVLGHRQFNFTRFWRSVVVLKPKYLFKSSSVTIGGSRAAATS